MKQKYMFAGVFVFLFLLMFMGIASATVTMLIPVTTINYTTLTVNCTMVDADLKEAMNMTVYYDDAAGIPDTTLGALIPNTSKSQVSFAATRNIESLDDGLLYNFTCVFWNDTEQKNSTYVAVVGIDNTAPVISVDRSGVAYIDYMTSVSLSCTATDATTTVDTYTRTLTKPSTETVTTSSSPHTFTGGDLNELGSYTFTCNAEDNAGNTNNDTVTFKVQTEDDELIEEEERKKAGTTGGLLFLLIFGFAAMIIVTFILIMGKRKK